MPAPDRMLRTIQQAAHICRQTPGRLGRCVTLTDCTELLISGDIHGNLPLLRQLIAQADLGRHPTRHVVVQELVHGPHRYPQGGDKSHQLVDVVAAWINQYPGRVHYLLGNHELAQWTERKIVKNDEEMTSSFAQGVRHAYGTHAEPIYESYLRLFAALPIALRTPNGGWLSHSLPNARQLGELSLAKLEVAEHAPDDLLPGGIVYAMTWGRDTAAEHVEQFLQRVAADWLITGHIAQPTGYARPSARHIILDSMHSPGAICQIPTTQPLDGDAIEAAIRLV
jgi:hypothetical protein